MKILIHKNAENPVRAISLDAEEVDITRKTCTVTLWELAEKFPDEIIGWCEESICDHINLEAWEEVFHHDLIMASYAVKTTFLSENIGYVDQLPFVNYNRNVLYATWRMSSDVGGIKGKVLLKFKNVFGKISGFDYLLNAIAKTGQQNGLFCYSAPDLVQINQTKQLQFEADSQALFLFVSQHYTFFRNCVLLWCCIYYEHRYPLLSFVKSLFKTSYFKQKVDLSDIKVASNKPKLTNSSIDVILPTMGRPQHLIQVLEDLSVQELLPQKVIIIEQNSDKAAKSSLDDIHEKTWPFIITHHFIHHTGACNARNMGLNEVSASWVFFCDDDNRFGSETLKLAISEIKKYGLEILNTAYLQPHEQPIYQEIKQWGTFGAGNAIVSSKSLQNIKFDPAFEHGYGEDKDFGMQLRNSGVDIIYHPEIKILHLKAAMGGFREMPRYLWSDEKIAPKPAPSLMIYAKKHYTLTQIRGFKVSLFIKYYGKQQIKNPMSYLRLMRKRWNKSEAWAVRLMEQEDKS